MDRRALGASGLQVSPLCLGGNVFGWGADEAASFAVLDAYVELGGNFIDTANIYSAWVPGNQGGESEALQKELARETERRYSKLTFSERVKLQLENLKSGAKA